MSITPIAADMPEELPPVKVEQLLASRAVDLHAAGLQLRAAQQQLALAQASFNSARVAFNELRTQEAA